MLLFKFHTELVDKPSVTKKPVSPAPGFTQENNPKIVRLNGFESQAPDWYGKDIS